MVPNNVELFPLTFLFLRVGNKIVLFLIKYAPKHFIYVQALPVLKIQIFENQKSKSDNPVTPVTIVKSLP